MRKVKAGLLMTIGELDLEIVECQAEHRDVACMNVLRSLLFACVDFLKDNDVQKLQDAIAPKEVAHGS
jgi:hypothetical protein